MRQRILTGILAIALFLLFLIIGSVPFTLFAALIAALVYTELVSMKGMALKSVPCIAGGIFVVLFVLQDLVPGLGFGFSVAKMAITLVLFLLISMLISRNTFSFDHAGHVFLSAFYIGYAFNLLVAFRSYSFWLILFILIIIWATDSGAYFVGRQWGKRKLSPYISPNKTVEGFVGGIIVSLIVAIIFILIVPMPGHTNLFSILFTTVVISIFGQIGDLCESAIKRHYNVKDSGHILPGHGGLLDRFDSLIFVLPILLVFNLI